MIALLLCCATLCFDVLAASPPTQSLGLNQIMESGISGINAPVSNPQANPTAKAPTEPAPASQGSLNVLTQDSGTNLTKMNITFTISPNYVFAQAVKFKTPKPNWLLENIFVMATDGWNASSKEQPRPLPFTIEVRDENLMLLYHYEGIQLPYFTGESIAIIDIPPILLNGSFYICFNGFGSLRLAAELQNATGNSYYYDERASGLYQGVLQLRNGQTVHVNWLIRAMGTIPS